MKPVLDRAKLDGLRAMIGEAKCGAALTRFKGELEDCLSAIESDGPDRAECAHRLAGVAGLLGFDDLEEQSRRFLAAVHGAAGDVPTTLSSLVEAAHRAEKELATII